MRPQPEQDLALAREALAGEGPERDRLFQRLRCVPRFVRAANRRLGGALDDASREDLAQEVLLLVWRKLPGFRGEAALETWVHRICTFQTLNAVRKAQRRGSRQVLLGSGSRTDAGAPEPAVSVPVDRGLVRAELRELLEDLSARESEVVRLRHFDGLEPSEIAEVLGVAPSTVKTFYVRALAKLRARLGVTPGASPP